MEQQARDRQRGSQQQQQNDWLCYVTHAANGSAPAHALCQITHVRSTPAMSDAMDTSSPLTDLQLDAAELRRLAQLSTRPSVALLLNDLAAARAPTPVAPLPAQPAAVAPTTVTAAPAAAVSPAAPSVPAPLAVTKNTREPLYSAISTYSWDQDDKGRVLIYIPLQGADALPASDILVSTRV